MNEVQPPEPAIVLPWHDRTLRFFLEPLPDADELLLITQELGRESIAATGITRVHGGVRAWAEANGWSMEHFLHRPSSLRWISIGLRRL